MAENEKYTARIPIVPDSLENRRRHKDKELVMDFTEDDLYIKRGDEYINITGEIREHVEQIQDGSSVIHIVTEETLPPISERSKNHWYFVVTESYDFDTQTGKDTSTYIYYGIINQEYYRDKSYLLVAQNMFTDPGCVKMRAAEDHYLCFYVPSDRTPRFSNDETGEELRFIIKDRLYCLTPTNTTISYDVYISEKDNLGDIDVKVEFIASTYNTVSIESNYINITGLHLEVTSVALEPGQHINSLPDPVWTEARYIFKGWSTNKVSFEEIDLETYSPDGDVTIYAYFEYDDDMSKYTYHASYRSSKSGALIGSFYSVAEPHTKIHPKEFVGYTKQTGDIELTREGQTIVFYYDPIQYPISYTLNGGELENKKDTYTIEDEYRPENPTKYGYSFDRWEPRRIEKGTIGNIVFEAIWDENGRLLRGDLLRDQITRLSANINTTCTKIIKSEEYPPAQASPINVSSTKTPILMWYDAKVSTLFFYSLYEIECHQDMSRIFERFTALRDISGLENWKLAPNPDLTYLFNECRSLADLTPISNWDITGKNFGNCFSDTAAYISGRLPNWYEWEITVRYVSTKSGKLLDENVERRVPNSQFYVHLVPKYEVNVGPYTVSGDEAVYDIDCIPNSYNITYVLNEGELYTTKNTYDIEDVENGPMYPDTPTRPGYSFLGWEPQYIPQNSVGDVVFTANWTNQTYSYTVYTISRSGRNLGRGWSGSTMSFTEILPIAIEGYTAPSAQIVDRNEKSITFIYEPIEYPITYVLNLGTLEGAKTTYNIEDNYIPPNPVREGLIFAGWQPERIAPGTTGPFTFIANWDYPIDN